MRSTPPVSRVALCLALLSAACASSARSQDSAGNPPQGELPPVGLGTLRQDDIALSIRQPELEIRVIPLDERLLRLLATDAYQSLHEVARSRAEAIDSVGRRFGVSTPGLFFITFYGRRSGARFDPQLISLVVRNQLYRPIGVVPYSSNFNSQQLDARQQASGFLLFEEIIPIFEPFTLSYGVASTDSWEGRLTRIQRERVRVIGKMRADSTGG